MKRTKKRYVFCAATGNEPSGLAEHIRDEYFRADRPDGAIYDVIAVAQSDDVDRSRVRFDWDLFVYGEEAVIDFVREDVAHEEREEPVAYIVLDGWTNPRLLITLVQALESRGIPFAAYDLKCLPNQFLWVYWGFEPSYNPE